MKSIVKKNQHLIESIFYPFVLTRVCLLVVGWFSQYFLPSSSHNLVIADKGFAYTSIRWLDVWGRWDTGWYLDIINRGYQMTDMTYATEQNVSFLPVYPMLVKFFGFVPMMIFQNELVYFISGILVANFSFLLALAVLYLLIKHLSRSTTIAQEFIWLLILFPTGFIFSSIYAESVYLLWISCFYWYLLKNNFFHASLFGLLASATRPLGLLLVLTGIVVHFEQGKDKKKWGWLWLCIIPIGLLMFNIFTYFAFGDFFATSRVKAAWGVDYTWIWETILNPVKYIGYITTIDKIGAILFLTLAVHGLKLLPRFSLSVLVFSHLIPPLTIGFLNSILRYAMVAFPLFLTLAILLHNRPRLSQMTKYLFFTLQILFFAAWSQYYWVA